MQGALSPATAIGQGEPYDSRTGSTGQPHLHLHLTLHCLLCSISDDPAVCITLRAAPSDLGCCAEECYPDAHVLHSMSHRFEQCSFSH
jgi:hypothetical protein